MTGAPNGRKKGRNRQLCRDALLSLGRAGPDVTGIPFEIRLQGLVDKRSLADFPELQVATAPPTTVLTGEAVDQTELVGLLDRLRAQGLVVTEIRRRPG